MEVKELMGVQPMILADKATELCMKDHASDDEIRDLGRIVFVTVARALEALETIAHHIVEYEARDANRQR